MTVFPGTIPDTYTVHLNCQKWWTVFPPQTLRGGLDLCAKNRFEDLETNLILIWNWTPSFLPSVALILRVEERWARSWSQIILSTAKDQRSRSQITFLVLLPVCGVEFILLLYSSDSIPVSLRPVSSHDYLIEIRDLAAAAAFLTFFSEWRIQKRSDISAGRIWRLASDGCANGIGRSQQQVWEYADATPG